MTVSNDTFRIGTWNLEQQADTVKVEAQAAILEANADYWVLTEPTEEVLGRLKRLRVGGQSSAQGPAGAPWVTVVGRHVRILPLQPSLVAEGTSPSTAQCCRGSGSSGRHKS
jgi:hypothetical protein